MNLVNKSLFVRNTRLGSNYSIKFLIMLFLYAFTAIVKANTFNVWPTTGYINETTFHFEVSTTTAVPSDHYIGVSLNGGNSVRLSGSGKSWSLSTKSAKTGTFNVKYHLHKSDGTKVGDLPWSGSFTVSAAVVPVINSLSPTSAAIGVQQTFTVSGSNLPSTIAMSLSGANCGSPYAQSSTSARIDCTPQTSGSRQFYVAHSPGTAAISGAGNLYVNVAEITSKPNAPVISISPGKTALPGTSMTLTFTQVINTSYRLCYGYVSGNYNFDCVAITSPYKFIMPEKLNIFAVVKALNGQMESGFSNELHVMSIYTPTDDNLAEDYIDTTDQYEYKTDNLSISSITPTIASINKPTIFTIRGENLEDNMGFFIEGCEGESIEYSDGDKYSRQFLCTPKSTPGVNKIEVRSGINRDTLNNDFTVEFRDDLLKTCEATITSDSFKLDVPYIIFYSKGDILSFSATFIFQPNNIKFELNKHDSKIIDPLDLILCEPAIMDVNYNINIPKIIFNGQPYSGFLEYITTQDGKFVFEATGAFR